MIRLINLLIVIGIMKVRNFKAPAFCNGLDCPAYSVISTQDNIEIREYSDSFWVSTKMKNGEQGELMKSGFMTLFNYISGKNDLKKKIEMTAPVLVKVDSKVPFTSDEEVAVMSFYMGQDEKAPQPNESNVFLQKLESKKYGVISYSGYSNRYKQEENLRILGNFLSKNGMKYVSDYYFYAGYDSPLRFFNRHNEVWVELL
jgi:hypothetical protein